MDLCVSEIAFVSCYYFDMSARAAGRLTKAKHGQKTADDLGIGGNLVSKHSPGLFSSLGQRCMTGLGLE